MKLKSVLLPKGEVWIRSRRKRCSDLAICALITPPALFIFLISVCAIRLFLGRPVFYSQQRIGRDGERFTLHKLRTFTMEGELTNLGCLLSVLGADETPQIIYDIWRGKMGVIGARPLVTDDFLAMRRVLGETDYKKWHRAYEICYPGWMSAFSQRSRLYSAQSHEYLLTRSKWEVWYQANACWNVDIRIFLRSLVMWCTDRKKLSRAITGCSRPSDRFIE